MLPRNNPSSAAILRKRILAAVWCGAVCIGCSSVLPYDPGGPRGAGRPVTTPVPGDPIPAPGSPMPSGPGSPIIGGNPPTTPNNTPPNLVPDPIDTPVGPTGNPVAQWTPWPLPPRQNSASVQNVSHQTGTAAQRGRPTNAISHPGSRSWHHHRRRRGLPSRAPAGESIVEGSNPTPAQDLHYRGGRTIQNLSYVNLYVSGEDGWSMTDVQNIDRALAAAMSDANLNNVIRQYFNNQTITATALPSHPLTGYRPQTVSRGDVEYYVQFLHQKGYLAQFDLPNTVFNFLLPRGTVLTSGDDRKNFAHVSGAEKADDDDDKPGTRKPIVPEDEEDDSKGGLGGYHGSVHIAGQTVYYSADVYSERLADGSANGIPVFAESWKNIVATLYHELQEARTDPDVEDAIRNPSDPNIERKLGWISDAGEEIGDFPLHDNVSLKNIIREVPLTDGSGTVPVQLQYSNAVHGPEGPIATLHPAAQ